MLPGNPTWACWSAGRPEAANGHWTASRLGEPAAGAARRRRPDVRRGRGPGRELTLLAGRVLAGRPHEAIAVDPPGEHGITGWLHALARLAVAGVAVDTAALHAGRDSDPARWEDPLPGTGLGGQRPLRAHGGRRPAAQGPAPRPRRPGAVAGQRPPRPDRRPPRLAGGQAAALSDGELAVVTEYLRVLQGMVAAGSEIVRHAAAAEGRA